jgi:hypothetical protein
LKSALPLVEEEIGTRSWFAVRFGRGEYGIFDVFPDDAGRQAHLSGPVAKALQERSDELFSEPPHIQALDALAHKLPGSAAPAMTVTRAILLTFPAKSGKDADVAEFLRSARSIVEDEPDTIAWFAIHLDDGSYGIFDVFPDAGGRFRHLIGGVPRELVKHGFDLLGGFPDPSMLDVLAYKLPR